MGIEINNVMYNFSKYWKDEKELIMMPNTISGKVYLKKILKDIPIKCILDNDSALDNTYFGEIPIYEASKYLKTNGKCKVLISAHYLEIAEQLDKLGYQENVDYIDMHKFVSLWYWEQMGKVHLLDVHIAITTYCSLNCRDCNMFINHYSKDQRSQMELKEFQENIKSLFKVADYCYKISILGGEPLLNKELPDMVQWLGECYEEKIGQIEIVTNGTIIATKELLEVCKRYQVNIMISDYGTHASSKQRIEELKQFLEERNITYRHKPDMTWKKFYFPRENQGVQFHTIREHMLNCNPVFRGLNDNKFYYCHIVWSAVKAGLLEENGTDYIDLNKEFNEEDKKNFLLYDLGVMKKGYVSLCEYCGGCGSDNTSVIPAGIQEEAL